MVFFRRVYYLYSDFEDGSHVNVGFVRVQSQNQIVKMFFQVKLPQGQQQERLGIYLFRRDIPAVWTKIAALQTAGAECSCRLAVSAESVEGGSWRFFDYHGIVLVAEETGDVLVYGSFDGGGIPQRREEPFYEPAVLHAAESETEKEAECEATEDTVEAADILSCEAAEEAAEAAEDLDNEAEAAAEAAVNLESKEMAHSEEAWLRMTGDLVKVRLFPSAECVVLRPFQMTRLPKPYWSLSANSFMLHGYYVYGHTVLMREVEKRNELILLCVPGRHTPGEKRLAESYGFPIFRPRTGQRQMGLPEGYWCREIVLEKESR